MVKEIHLRLPDEVYEELRKEAETTGISLNQLIIVRLSQSNIEETVQRVFDKVGKKPLEDYAKLLARNKLLQRSIKLAEKELEELAELIDEKQKELQLLESKISFNEILVDLKDYMYHAAVTQQERITLDGILNKIQQLHDKLAELEQAFKLELKRKVKAKAVS